MVVFSSFCDDLPTHQNAPDASTKGAFFSVLRHKSAVKSRKSTWIACTLRGAAYDVHMTSRPRIAHIGQIALRGLRGFVSSESPANDSSFTSVFGGIDLSRQIEKQNATTEIVSQRARFFAHLRGIMFDTILAVD